MKISGIAVFDFNCVHVCFAMVLLVYVSVHCACICMVHNVHLYLLIHMSASNVSVESLSFCFVFQKKSWKFHKEECRGFQRISPHIPKDAVILMFRLILRLHVRFNWFINFLLFLCYVGYYVFFVFLIPKILFVFMLHVYSWRCFSETFDISENCG